jgi:uncharacterized protein
MAVTMLAAAQQLVPASKPSFDCTRARSKAEKTICADAQLAALDQRTSELFGLALSHSPDPGDIKKEQRRWLRERDDCEDAACMAKSYEGRIEVLETYTGRLPERLARTLCARLETPETRAETLERRAGIEDINNDGAPETAAACAGGTANVPCVSYVDARGKPVLIQPQGFEWTTYSPLGRAAFRYENRTFVYYSRDAALAEPSHLAYVTPTNREFRVCEFETSVGSAVLEGGDDVCAAVETREGIEPVELVSAADRQATAFGRPDTFVRSTGAADIDNDGLDDEVIELSYESGGGQGCTFNYFELLGEDRRSLIANSKSNPVRELQGLTGEGYRGRNCGNVENRLFKFDGKTYYETNVTNNRLVPHEVRVLDGTAPATLCTFERQVTTKVKTLF